MDNKPVKLTRASLLAQIEKLVKRHPNLYTLLLSGEYIYVVKRKPIKQITEINPNGYNPYVNVHDTQDFAVTYRISINRSTSDGTFIPEIVVKQGEYVEHYLHKV